MTTKYPKPGRPAKTRPANTPVIFVFVLDDSDLAAEALPTITPNVHDAVVRAIGEGRATLVGHRQYEVRPGAFRRGHVLRGKGTTE